MDVDFYSGENQKDDKQMFIGFAARQALRVHEDDLNENTIKVFYADVREFYCAALGYMKKRFPMKNAVLKAARYLDPRKRLFVPFEDIMGMLSYFSGIISDGEVDSLQCEYELYQISKNTEIGLTEEQDQGSVRIDSIWQQISSLTYPSSGQKMYPLLCKLSKYLLLIPHSNAYCETIFNMVRKVQTETRSQLGKDNKQARSSSSVYSDSTGIRNTLVGILSAKVNLFSSVACYEWKPSTELVKKARSITYKTLKQRREQQEHAERTA